MNFGFRLGSCIFSRRRAMWLMTVLLLSMYFSPHTASNSSSLGTTCPRCSQRYQRMANSSGVSASSSPKRTHLCVVLEICSPRKSCSAVSLGSAASPVLYRV